MAAEAHTPSAEGQAGAPHVLIWLSGLSEQAVDQSVLTVAHRVATVLDHAATTGRATFPVEPSVRTERFSGSLTTEIATIARLETPDAQPVPVIDVYRLAIHDSLTKRFDQAKPVFRALLTLHALWICRVRAVKPHRTVAKTAKERRQALFSQLYIASFFLYLLFLLASAVATVLPPDNAVLRYIAYGPALVTTVVGLWKARALPALVSGTAAMTSAIRYLEGAEGRDALRGQFTALLEHLGQRRADPYDVKVIGYSFGSLVAVDALFPSAPPAEPRYARVSGLATIGCPFDYVRTYWPEYFSDRYVTEDAPSRWLNVCRLGDVFGSNFRADSQPLGAENSIETRAQPPQPAPPKVDNRFYPSGDRGDDPSLPATLALVGLQRHTMYWEGPLDATEDAFSLVAADLYRGSPILA